MKYVKIYGLQRTGTNYIEKLININFSHTVFENGDITGWKHGKVVTSIDWSGSNWVNPDVVSEKMTVKKYLSSLTETDKVNIQNSFDSNNFRYIFCFKNPYSWYYSICKALKKLDVCNDDSMIEYEISRYNEINSNYLNFIQDNPNISYLLRYEDIFENYKLSLSNIHTKLELNSIHKDYKNIEKVIAPRGHVLNNKHNTKLYKQKEYLNMLGEDVINKINKIIDDKIMMKLKYDKE